MKIKAKTNFCGALTMAKGETRECSDETVLTDLLRAGYVEEVKEDPAEKKPRASPKRGVKADESK